MVFDWLLTAVAATLNILVVAALVRGQAFRRYRAIGLFCLVEIVAILVDTFGYSNLDRRAYASIYWAFDFVVHFFLTLVILGLIRSALRFWHGFAWVPYGLFAGMVVFACLSLLVLQSPNINAWFIGFSRNLSFGEEVLNLILWTLLLQRGELDLQLIILSAGIGFQVTGEVIGLTLRPYTTDANRWVPDLLVQFCELLCLAIWLWAFSRKRLAVQT